MSGIVLDENYDKDYGLEELHRELLKALNVVDRICRDNEIHYSLHGGTLIGAVRNGRLIPWDDDLDISMTRKNLNKFRKACENDNGGYYLNEIDTWVPRFAKRGSNIFIDVFTWDYISEAKISQKIKINLLRVLQGALKRNIDYTKYSRKNRVLLYITHIAGIPFARDQKVKAYKYIAEKWFVGKRRKVFRSDDTFEYLALITSSEYIKKYKTITLENNRYMVFSDYEKYLVQTYGEDYLIPPDIEERHPEHVSQREGFIGD